MPTCWAFAFDFSNAALVMLPRRMTLILDTRSMKSITGRCNGADVLFLGGELILSNNKMAGSVGMD